MKAFSVACGRLTALAMLLGAGLCAAANYRDGRSREELAIRDCAFERDEQCVPEIAYRASGKKPFQKLKVVVLDRAGSTVVVSFTGAAGDYRLKFAADRSSITCTNPDRSAQTFTRLGAAEQLSQERCLAITPNFPLDLPAAFDLRLDTREPCQVAFEAGGRAMLRCPGVPLGDDAAVAGSWTRESKKLTLSYPHDTTANCGYLCGEGIVNDGQPNADARAAECGKHCPKEAHVVLHASFVLQEASDTTLTLAVTADVQSSLDFEPLQVNVNDAVCFSPARSRPRPPAP